MTKIAVIGAGTWGIALARLLSVNGHNVFVWSAIESEIDNLNKTRVHHMLSEMDIPDEMVFTKDIGEAMAGCDVVLMAVPSVFVRSTSEKIKEYFNSGMIIVDVAKGMEASSLFTMSEIINDVIPEAKVVALTGPTHAEEVAFDQPTTIVAASRDEEAAEFVQDIFMTDTFRVYTNSDIKGVEFAGAIKNVMALGVGISRGIGYGDNTTAALITRGLAEIVRLGEKMGCNRESFYGLAGVGDLIVTCTSVHSRNFKAGRLLGMGKSAEEAKKEVGMVVEGMNMLPAAMKLKETYNVEMPIVEAVYEIVNGMVTPEEAVGKLMGRDRRGE
ncbi:MAG: NAD(P)-dependent glycerol-3-phosphate dehydrogenase [Clostridia bacterium]|nr:NAD(P)-dependent glycerol-3-phosphate dehydrogenase [Clostridia bacterium]